MMEMVVTNIQGVLFGQLTWNLDDLLYLSKKSAPYGVRALGKAERPKIVAKKGTCTTRETTNDDDKRVASVLQSTGLILS